MHFNASPDGKLFAGDGGGPKSVAAPGNGQWIYLFTPTGDGKLIAKRLVDLSKHDAAECYQRPLTLFVRQQTPELVERRGLDDRQARGGAMSSVARDMEYLLEPHRDGRESSPPA